VPPVLQDGARAEKRRKEMARMLAGGEITAEARAAAERLIKPMAG
jgi:DNA repair protein RecN (Recombination protein N)